VVVIAVAAPVDVVVVDELPVGVRLVQSVRLVMMVVVVMVAVMLNDAACVRNNGLLGWVTGIDKVFALILPGGDILTVEICINLSSCHQVLLGHFGRERQKV
jgi:hypothetical protein